MSNLKRFQERTGYSIVPVSYFEPIPDLRQVDTQDLSRDSMLELSFEFDASFIAEAFSAAQQAGLDVFGLPSNKMYGGNDAAAYFGMIKTYSPRHIIEIGSGHSALLAKRATLALQLRTKITSIEPYPIDELRKMAASPANVELIEKRAETLDETDLKMFSQLEVGDILFIDTSHVTVRGGDTNFIFCRILPLVKPGVVIHIHDIFLPYDYDRRMYFVHGRFYTEQYLLAAVLANSDRFKPLLSVYRAATDDPGRVELPDTGGSAFWMKRV